MSKRHGFKRYQRGDSDLVGLIILACIGLFVWWWVSNTEREGYVKHDDCRETVILSPNSLQKYIYTFTCSSYRTKSGKVINGECVRVEYEGFLFSSSKACSVAYVYEMTPACSDPKYPYMGKDERCYASLP